MGPRIIILLNKEKTMNKTLTTRNLPTFFNERGIGFNRMFDMFEDAISYSGTQTYPPYNLLQLDDNNFAVEVALAGFSEDDITITKDGNKLKIEGEKKTEESDANVKTDMYLHRGISSRAFTREFILADYIEVIGATMKDGILFVQMQREIPEEMKPKQIAINKTIE